MTILNDKQCPIDFSLGSNQYDNCPEQRSVPDFREFTEAIWAHISERKGMTYICAPLSAGLHNNQTKYLHEKTWRLKKLVQPRRFLALDIDGMTPDAWQWLRTWLRQQKINCCWYTTSSHTAELPRTRIMIELGRPVNQVEGECLGKAFESHIQSQCPHQGAIKFDQSVYRGEQPIYLPVINEQTRQHTEMDKDCQHAICDQQPLDVQSFLSMIPTVKVKSSDKPAIDSWQQKSQTEQAEHIEAFKQGLRDWAEAGANKGFDSDDAQAKEAALRHIGSIWNWCWVFDELSKSDVLAELLKTPINELGEQGRNKWLATVTLAARLAPLGSGDAGQIKEAVFEWSEEHECYENDYDFALEEFEKVWAEGEHTTSETNLPIKLLFNLRKRKKCLPQLLMTDGSLFDVLVRASSIEDLFKPLNNFSHAEIKTNFEKMLRATQQLPLFEEPLEQDEVVRARFKFWSCSELQQRKPIEWRVKHVLPKTGLAAVYGASGSGKTFLVLDLLARISLGRDFFGHKAVPCPIVYACLEGLAGISNRVKAWEEKHQTTLPSDFRIMADQLSLANQDAEQFALAVNTNGLGGGVIVIDTLNQSAPTADENSSKDMGIIIQNAQTIQRLTNSLVILVHHTGKDKSRGLRGHSSLIAALDSAIEVKVGSLTREWALTKAKDAENIAGQLFLLESVPLGVDDEGEAISSCVIMPNQAAIFEPPPPTGKNQKIVLDALQGLLVNKASISRSELVDHVRSELGGEPKRHNARVAEALESLINSGQVFEIEQGVFALERPKAASPFF